MKCIVCYGEDIREAEVREEIRVGNDIVEVPVTTLVCRTCGERYFDPPTMRYLEQVEDELKSSKIHLEQTGNIYSYSHAKAA